MKVEHKHKYLAMRYMFDEGFYKAEDRGHNGDITMLFMSVLLKLKIVRV